MKVTSFLVIFLFIFWFLVWSLIMAHKLIEKIRELKKLSKIETAKYLLKGRLSEKLFAKIKIIYQKVLNLKNRI